MMCSEKQGEAHLRLGEMSPPPHAVCLSWQKSHTKWLGKDKYLSQKCPSVTQHVIVTNTGLVSREPFLQSENVRHPQEKDP